MSREDAAAGVLTAAQVAGITSIRRTAPARVRPSQLAGGQITTHFARFCLFSYKIRALGNELLVIRASEECVTARPAPARPPALRPGWHGISPPRTECLELTRRSSPRRSRASYLCILIRPTTYRLWRPELTSLRSFPRAFEEVIYAGCWIRISETLPSTHSGE